MSKENDKAIVIKEFECKVTELAALMGRISALYGLELQDFDPELNSLVSIVCKLNEKISTKAFNKSIHH